MPKPLEEKYNNAISALEKAGLVERMLKVGRIASIEIVSLIQHYKGDRHFEGLVREDQVDELLLSLVFKTSGPCTAKDALARANVLCEVKAREMARKALDLFGFPFGARTTATNTPQKADENRMIEWNWGAMVGVF